MDRVDLLIIYLQVIQNLRILLQLHLRILLVQIPAHSMAGDDLLIISSCLTAKLAYAHHRTPFQLGNKEDQPKQN